MGKSVSLSESQEPNNRSNVTIKLAKQITQGDTNATNAFVELNYKWLLFIVRRNFYRSNNHEDIVQDTFMIVIDKLQQGKIDHPKAILSFLRRTAYYVGQDYLRKDKKFTSSIDQDLLETIEHAQEDVLSQMIWDDKVNYIKQVMTELSQQRDKEILTRFYFENEDKTTICTDLELTAAHFDRVIFRAKQRLKALIEKQQNNPPPSKLSLVEEKKKKVSQRFISLLFKYTVNAYLKMTKRVRFFA